MEEGNHYKSNVIDGDLNNNDYILPPESVRVAYSVNPTKPLPKEFSRRDLTPDIKDQGPLDSCVGFATALVMEDNPQYRGLELSPMWIYQKAKEYDEWAGEDYKGTSISGACKALKEEGVCVEELWPYTLSEDTYPNFKAYTDASTRKIHSYYKILPQQTQLIKEVLLNESLVTAIAVHDNFLNVRQDGFVQVHDYFKTESVYGHALALIGWKEIDKTLYWEFQNSWGNYFGDEGCCYIKADLFSKICIGGLYYLITNEEVGNKIKKEYRNIKPKRYKWYQLLKYKLINLYHYSYYQIYLFFKRLKKRFIS